MGRGAFRPNDSYNGSRAMSGLETVRAHGGEVRSIVAKHGAGNVRLFGSVARGQERSESDIDLLIDIVAPLRHGSPGRF